MISVHMLCLDDCFATTTMPQPTEITQFIFGQPLSRKFVTSIDAAQVGDRTWIRRGADQFAAMVDASKPSPTLQSNPNPAATQAVRPLHDRRRCCPAVCYRLTGWDIPRAAAANSGGFAPQPIHNTKGVGKSQPDVPRSRRPQQHRTWDDGRSRSRLPNTSRISAALFYIMLILIPAVYYLFFVMDGSFNLFKPIEPTARGMAFNSMLEHLQHGEFDIDPAAIGSEGFVRDGKTYTYFGIIPALLRFPLLLTGGLMRLDVTRLYCALAATLALCSKFATVALINDKLPKSPLQPPLLLSFCHCSSEVPKSSF